MNATRSFLTPRVSARCVTVPGWLTVKDVADATRSAALGFAWGADRGWGRLELARWLVGPYARAVSVSRAARQRVRRPFVARRVGEATVRDLLQRSHEQLIEGLRTAWAWRSDAKFAREMIDQGFVIGVIDASNDVGYAAVDAPDLRLLDRVRALFVADFLTRPDDYATFAVCASCGGATFDGAGSHASTCSSRPTVSLRRRRVVALSMPPTVDEPVVDSMERPTLLGLGSGYRPTR